MINKDKYSDTKMIFHETLTTLEQPYNNSITILQWLYDDSLTTL